MYLRRWALTALVAESVGERTLSRAELASEAGLPEALIGAILGAGLIVPVEVDGEERFSEADLEMARAGMQAIADETGQTYEEARQEAIGVVPLQRIGEPEEVAGLVEFLLSPDAVSFTGQALDPNGGSWMG